MIDPDNTDQALTAGGVKSRGSEQASREKQPVRAAAAEGRVLSGAVRAGCRGTIVYLPTTEREKRAITRIALREHAPRIWVQRHAA